MNIALKEWAVIVQAMMQGKHHFLLRKGGLADRGQTFKTEHSKFLLFPTYEHQKESLIMSEYRSLYQSTLAQASMDEITITSWAETAETFLINDFSVLKSLSPWHIWSEDYLKMRFNYKPEKPLYLLILRTYQLHHFKKIKNFPKYAGCRSWVHLDEICDLEFSNTVISDFQFQSVLQQIHQALQK